MKNVNSSNVIVPKIKSEFYTRNYSAATSSNLSTHENLANSSLDKTVDSVNLGQPTQLLNKLYSSLPAIDNTSIELHLPNDDSFIDYNRVKYYHNHLQPNLNKDLLIGLLRKLKNPLELNLVLTYLANSSNKNLINQALEVLTAYNSKETLTNIGVVKGLHIKLLEKFAIIGKSKQIPYNTGKIPNTTLPIKFLEAFSGKFSVFSLACMNGNKEFSIKILRDFFLQGEKYLQFTSQDKATYKSAVEILSIAIKMVHPPYMADLITYFQKHLIHSEEAIGLGGVLCVQNRMLDAHNFFCNLMNSEPEVSDIKNLCQWIGSLSSALFRLNENEKGIEQCFNFLKYKPKDYGIIKDIITATIKIGKPSIAYDLLSSSPLNQDIKLLTIYLNINCGKSDASVIKEINMDYISKSNHSLYHILNSFNTLDGIDDLVEQEIVSHIDFLKKLNVDNEGIISLCFRLKQENLAQNIVKNIPVNEIRSNFTLAQYKSLLINTVDFENEVSSYNFSAENKAIIFQNAAILSISQEDFNNAEHLINTAIKFDGTNNEFHYTKACLESINSKRSIKDEIPQIAHRDTTSIALPESKDDQVSNISNNATKGLSLLQLNEDKLNETQNNDEFASYFSEDYKSPKEIHEEYNILKGQKLSNLSYLKTDKGWNINNISHKLNEVVLLGKYNNLQYYGCIDGKLQKKVVDQISQFNSALSKGFTVKSFNQNGVKFISKSAIELKINDDMRLYTNNIYVNSNKALLIIFDHYGNHNDVKRFASNNKINYQNVT